MAETNNDKLKEIIAQAAEIAALVPENMQGEAFNRAFEALRGTVPTPSNNGTSPSPSNSVGKQTDGDTLSQGSDWWLQLQPSKYPEIFDAQNAKLRFMRILQIARDDFNTEYVTPPTISQLLLKKFKISVTPTTVSARLGEVVRLLDRQEEGSGYKYALMHAGDEYLKANASKFEAGSAAKSTSSATKHTTKKPAKDKVGAKPKATRTGSRPAQKALLDSLIKAGFFDQPKTVADIIKHVSKNQGYTYSPNDLSTPLVRFLRDGKLTRDTNGNSQYEYTKK